MVYVIHSIINTLGRGAPFTFLCGLTLIPALMINYMLIKVCDEMTSPFPNFNSYTQTSTV